MPRFSDLEFGFCCPHRNGCPYLEGLSTHWVWKTYQEARDQSSENIKFQDSLITQLNEAQLRVQQLEKENALLKATNLALHRRQFKSRRCAPAPPLPGSTPEKKKRGAPTGHAPWQRARPKKIDHTVVVAAPEACPHCQQTNLQPVHGLSQHIQEDIVLEPQVVTTCYKHHQAYCPDCQRTVCQSGPGEMPGSYIGPVAKSTATYLRHTLGVSHRKISRFFREFFGLNFVPASSLGFDTQTTRKGWPIYQDIHAKIKASSLVHADETFWRHDGKNSYVWYAGHQDLAFFQFVRHRSTKEAQDLLGESFGGTLVADAYASYNGTHPPARQSCLSHLIRTSKDLDQALALLEPPFQDPAARRLCQKATDIFQRTCHAANLFHRGQMSPLQALDAEKQFRRELNSICEHPLTHPAAETFRKRLVGPEQSLFFTCLRDPKVPPTNNQAEQSLRPIVIMRKIIQCTRGQTGLDNHSVLHTLVQTARRQGRDVRNFLENLLTADIATAQAALYRNTS